MVLNDDVNDSRPAGLEQKATAILA